MRILALCGWLLIPLLVGAWHYGPGQDQLRNDDVAKILRDAERDVKAENWSDAVAAYDEALKLLPTERKAEARQIRLERSKAQMLNKQLPAAHTDLKNLVAELQDDPKADAKLLAEARAVEANSQYYMTWLMRLEGKPKEEWEPEIEASRQNYRLLAEQAEARGDKTGATKYKEDLESSIRLARMDLSDLQGLPLPSQ